MRGKNIMSRAERAVAYFDQGFNCSQSVCTAFAEQFGVDHETALKIAAGFGSGMGRMAGTCGAVTGAFMAIGLKYGAVKGEDKQAKETTYAQVRAFAKRFADRHGTLVCKELLECDISTPEGLKQAHEQNLFKTRCAQLVKSAAEILEEMLNVEC
jgi:C_GCAxxG_C_C family probable redox protein